MNIAREIRAASTDLRYAEMLKADLGVPRNFLVLTNNALGDMMEGASQLDFTKAKQAAELLVDILNDNPENAESMGFDRKAVELIKRAPKIFGRAQIRIEDADDHLYLIEKAVKRLSIGR